MTIIAPDLEALLVRALSEAFPTHSVSTSLPPGPISGRRITVVSNGGPQLNPHVDQAQVNLWVFNPSPEEVMDDALEVQAFINTLVSDGIREARASYPARVVGDDTSPRRFMYADFRIRKDVR